MNLKLLATYAQPLTDLTDLIVANRKAGAAESEARDARKGGLVDTLRNIAIATHNDGVPTAEASEMLRFSLNMPQDAEGKQLIPSGTVKNYASALRGFHKLLQAGRDISEVTTAEANAEVASEEQKRITAAKKEFAGYSKKWNADKWEALAAQFKPEPVVAATAEESAEVEAEAKAA